MKIIVNADDYALNSSITKAICMAFQQGLITDTTMMATGDAFDAAVEMISKCHLEDRIGIHFNLTEGIPLTDSMRRCSRFVEKGYFIGGFDRFRPLSSEEKAAVYNEFTSQIKRVREAGVKVTHADSHHHVHTAYCIASVFAQVCSENEIKKVRIHRNLGEIPVYKQAGKILYNHWLRYKGFTTSNFFGSLEDVEKITRFKAVTEIMVHPDIDKNGNLVDRTSVESYPIGNSLLLTRRYLTKENRSSYKEL